MDPVKTSHKERLQSASPTAALLESKFRLNAVLMGSEVASTAVQVDFCSYLIGAQVRVLFDGTPSNLTGEDRNQVDAGTVVPTGDDEPAQAESGTAIKVMNCKQICYQLSIIVFLNVRCVSRKRPPRSLLCLLI